MARVLIPLAQGCEELEAVTLTDLLTRAGIEVITAGLDDRPVKASRGLTILPDTQLDRVMDDHFDLIVLPGGLPGADHLNADPRIHQLLNRQAEHGRFIGAICAAPKVLADAGLLAGKKATSYPGAVDLQRHGSIDYINDPVVRDQLVVTSRGPGTAMDFALYLIELLVDSEMRNKVEEALLRP